jgi:hypothetical protein
MVPQDWMAAGCSTRWKDIKDVFWLGHSCLPSMLDLQAGLGGGRQELKPCRVSNTGSQPKRATTNLDQMPKTTHV